MLNRLEIPDGFQKNNFKDQMREGYPRVCDWLVHNSLMVDGAITRLRHRGKHYQSLGSGRPGAIGTHRSQVILPLVGRFSHLQNNLGNLHPILLSRYFPEKLKQRKWSKACPRKVP